MTAAARLPVRLGVPAGRELGLPLPAPGAPACGRRPRGLALVRRGRPLKRWRWLGAFGPDLMLCAAEAFIGPLRQRWWAVAQRGEPLLERSSLGSAGLWLGGSRVTIDSPRLRLELELSTGWGTAIEVVSPAARDGWTWTRKQALLASGRVEADGAARKVALEAVIDDSAGYHDRHTAWSWSTGVGRAESGERVAWNLVAGIHDAAAASERTLWVEGEPRELGPVAFAGDLSSVSFDEGGRLAFRETAVREHRTNLALLRSSYRQPFGTFAGELPGDLRIAEGRGVMERHDVHW